LATIEAKLRTLTEAFNLVPWTVSRDERPASEQPAGDADFGFQDYTPEYIGPQFEKLFGYPTSRWFEPGFWLSMIHPEDLPAALANAAEREAEPVVGREEYRMIAADGRVVPVLVLTTPTLLNGRRILSGVIVDLTEIKAAERAQDNFMRELDHRVKNTFASVQSILEQTLLTTDDVGTFLATFHGRIAALANIHNTMASSDWTDVDLRELVESALAPYGEPPRVATDGESIRISLNAGRVLGMVLHELATNAVKYGSMSTLEGNVFVRWRSEHRDGHPVLVLQWVESGGPPVSRTTDRGYGLRVIEELVPYELSGRAHVTFAEDGLCCNVEIPLTEMETGRDFAEGAL
jgi:PAS domain S-box-containing protein